MKKLVLAILLMCVIFLSVLTGCAKDNVGDKNGDMSVDKQESNFGTDAEIENIENSDYIEKIPSIKKTVTEVVYQEVTPYFDNRILVKQAGKYGIIDNLGNIIMPIAQPYTIKPLNMNAVAFVDNKKLGVLSLSGEVLVPAIYNDIDTVNEDLIRLKKTNIYEKDSSSYDDINKFYSIKKGDYLNLEIVGYVENVVAGQDFFIITYSTREKQDMRKIITFEGEIVDIDANIPSSYIKMDLTGGGSRFNYGTIYKTSNNNEYIVYHKHLIDINGNTVVDLSGEDCHFVFDDSRDFCCSDEIIISENIQESGEKNYYNHYVFNLMTYEKKKIDVLDENALVTDVMSNGFFEINVWYEDIWNDYYGLMNDKYEIVLEPIYDAVDDYVNGYCPIELNGYIGFVDENGNSFPPQIPEENVVEDDIFTYLYTPPYGRGSLINPRTGEILPYEEADLKDDFDGAEKLGIFEAILWDEDTGAKYKSFVTWDGPIVEHKFPNTEIKLSDDGKVAVYSQGAVYTIVELE